MKLKLLFITVLSLISALVWTKNAAAVQVGKQEVAVTLTGSYASRYIWRGQDLFPKNNGIFSPAVDVALKNLFKGTDLSFNVWGGFPTHHENALSTEVDYAVKVSHNFKDFNLSVGQTYFDYPRKNDRADTNELWTSFSWFKIPLLPLDVSLNLFAAYDRESKLGGPEQGLYYSWGFGTKVPVPASAVTQKGQSLAFAITNWGNDGVGGLKPSALYSTEYLLTTSYVMGRITITPGIHYVANYVDSINNKNEIWGGLDVSYSF